MKSLFSAIVFSCVLAFSGCKKEDVGRVDCSSWRKGLLTDDVSELNKALGHLAIAYSKANVERLAASISEQCGMAATVHCFECIKTNPPQTEIRFSFSQSGATIEKTVDLTYTPGRKIRIVKVHE